MSQNRPSTRVKIAFICVSTLLALLFAELAYRAYLRLELGRSHNQIDYSYRMTPSVQIEYDEKYGFRPKPNTAFWMSSIRDGQVVWGSVISVSNADGLAGKSTINEYNHAELKVLVFGDSYSQWNQQGVTWPDILEQNLLKSQQKRVAVLDYARAGYGVLQMLDLAADKIEEHRPDLVIIATIGNDFTRGRWWAREVTTEGITRWMLSSRKDDFLDYRFAVDEYLVCPEATREWCEKQVLHGNSDPVLEKANSQFGRLKIEVESQRKSVPWISWGSFLYKRIVTGSPLEETADGLPRLSINDFREDEKTRENVKRIRAGGAPVLLVYLPKMPELRKRRRAVNYQSEQLMASLEQMLLSPFHLIQQEYAGAIPAKIDLRPYDGHPNREGLQFYADAITPLALAELVNSGGRQIEN
jgi:hypothetical protein